MKTTVLFLILALAAIQCHSAPAPEPATVYQTDSEEVIVPDSQESLDTANSEEKRPRDSRFLKEYLTTQPIVGSYLRTPYHYGYGVPIPSNYYYQPLFQYRQARRKKKKRLFVPNFWG